MLSAEIIRELREDHAESVQVIVCILTLFIVFSMLHTISITSD